MVGWVLWTLMACLPAQAQQANQPGYDSRQTEKRFEDQQSRQSPAGRPRLPTPQFARPEGQGNSKPLFVLRRVSIGGATAIPSERVPPTDQPYIWEREAEAELIAVASPASGI